MGHIKSQLLEKMVLMLLSFFLLGSSALATNDGLVQQLPPEYDNMKGFIVAWLPWAPIPGRPITDLSTEQIAMLNEETLSNEYGYGHNLKPKYNKMMAERIKLKKGAGSPNTEGLDIDVYPYQYMMLDLVKAIIDSGATAHIVTNKLTAPELIEFMVACGFKQHDLEKIVFHYFSLDSIWVRDYGPWITEANNHLEVIDNKYFDGRPADDMFPEFFSQAYGLPKTDFDQIYTEGGNILTDSHGRGFSTQAILLFNPGLGYDDAINLFEDILNLEDFVFLPGDIPDDIDEALAALGGTGHVDMGLKLLSDTKVMIGDFPPGTFGKDLLDRWAEWFKTHMNPEGKPYEVYRVTGSTNGFEPYSYVNSVIVNKTIIVPQFGHFESDAAAIAAYESALPGYKTIGVRSEMLPPLAGGLHCITKEIPLGKLKAADTSPNIGPGADYDDRENHDDLVWVNDGIGDFNRYYTYPDPFITAPAVMAATLGLSVGKENPDNFIVPWPDRSNYDYLNPFNNIPFMYPSYAFLNTDDWVLRNDLLFPQEPKSAIDQIVYMNPDIAVVSVGTADLAAWNGLANTPPETFSLVMDDILFNHLSLIQASDPGKKIVLTTPFNYGALLIAIAQAYGQEPTPADIEEDKYATLYAEIIHEKVHNANSQGMNVAVADFNAFYKSVAEYPGVEIQGIVFNIATLDLLIDPATWWWTDLFSALHARIVINSINQHYGESYPLPDLTSYLPTYMYSPESLVDFVPPRASVR